MLTEDPFPRTTLTHKTPDKIRACFSFTDGAHEGGVIFSDKESLDDLIEEAKEMVEYFINAPRPQRVAIAISQGKYGWLGTISCVVYCVDSTEKEIVVSSRLNYLKARRAFLLKHNPGRKDYINKLFADDIAFQEQEEKALRTVKK